MHPNSPTVVNNLTGKRDYPQGQVSKEGFGETSSILQLIGNVDTSKLGRWHYLEKPFLSNLSRKISTGGIAGPYNPEFHFLSFPPLSKLGYGDLNLFRARSGFLACPGNIGIKNQPLRGKVQRQDAGPPFHSIWTRKLHVLLVF